MEINGRIWQDQEAYNRFMSREKNSAKQNCSKEELLERDLEELIKAIKNKKEYFETTLRARNDALLVPGSSILMSTGITTAILDDYTQAVEIINILNSNSWLRVTPFLISQKGLSYIDLRNFAQIATAQNEHLSSVLIDTLQNDSRIYVQNIEDIDEKTKLHHVAYQINTGDKIATLKLRKKK